MLSRGIDTVDHLIACRIAVLVLAIYALSVAAGTLPAQQTVGVNAGTVNYIEGEVFLDGNPVQLPKGKG